MKTLQSSQRFHQLSIGIYMIVFHFFVLNWFFFRPTLFIGGAESDYIPVTDHDDIKEIFPIAQFKYVQDAGHWVHSQKPAEVMQLIKDFLK